jgi:hypothetical protein
MAIKWSSWESVGKPEEADIGRPFVQRNQDGRLEVFALGRGEIFNISQISPNGAWRDGWRSKGKPSPEIGIKAHVVGKNADGRLEIFGIGDDHALWQKWQVAPNNGWSDTWKSLGSPDFRNLTGQFTVGRNQDGRQEVFAVAAVDVLRFVAQNWQTTPNGGWSGWKGALVITVPLGVLAQGGTQLAIRESDRITVGRNEDGRQELFVIAEDDALWHIWQAFPNAGWSNWESLGKPRDLFDRSEPPKDRDLSQPLVQKNADGHLEVFSPGNGAFCNRWQEAPNSNTWRHQGWNAKPKPDPAVGIAWLEAALNFGGPLDRKVEVLALGDDGNLWHAWQIDVAPFWSKWENLGSPPAKIRTEDHLTIGTNQDGRLEAFVMGQDGNVWHTWQTR